MRVPTLVFDDGRSLGESGAIIWHFAEGSPLIPADAFERAQVLQWMFFEQYDHEPAIAVVRFWVKYSGGPRRSPIGSTSGWPRGTGRSRQWRSTSLPGGSTSSARSRHLADIALFAYTHVAPEGGFELEPYPAIRGGSGASNAMPGHVPIDA